MFFPEPAQADFAAAVRLPSRGGFSCQTHPNANTLTGVGITLVLKNMVI